SLARLAARAVGSYGFNSASVQNYLSGRAKEPKSFDYASLGVPQSLLLMGRLRNLACRYIFYHMGHTNIITREHCDEWMIKSSEFKYIQGNIYLEAVFDHLKGSRNSPYVYIEYDD
ncbi:MAG: hypothetical protein ACKOCX_13235, partial [Planctomycetota bacterium]